MSERFDFTGDELTPAYRAAVDAIEAGDLVVLPTDTVYGLAADAFKADAVQRLLDAKGRGRDMPPPVLISVVESLDALATDVPDDGRKLCEAFWPGPLTVICHAQSSLMWDLGETHGTVALRVPDHENTRELLSRTGPLAVSSANLSGQPAALDVYEAEAQLLDAVAVYLDGGPVYGGEPSTIVDLTGDTPYVVRVGALSIERLREVVPGLGNDDDPAPTDAENPDPKKPDLAEADPAFTDPAKADAEKPDAEKPDPAEADLEKPDPEKPDPAEADLEEADLEKADLEKADLEKAAAGRSSGLEPGRDGSADEVLFSEEGAGEGPVVGESSVKPVGLDPEGERSVTEGPAAEVPSAEPLPDLDPEGENAVQERRAADKRAAEDPVAEDPVHEKPAAGSSAARGPAGVDSAVVEPAVVESAPEEPAPVEPAPEESVDAESVVVESAREEPAVVKPAREEPAVEEPAFVEPADGSGIDDGPGRKSPAE